MIGSAASAASLGYSYVKFQAVIKSASRAASQIQGAQVQGSARTTVDGGTTGTAGRRIKSGDGGGALPWTWVPWIWEAELAVDLITAWNFA